MRRDKLARECKPDTARGCSRLLPLGHRGDRFGHPGAIVGHDDLHPPRIAVGVQEHPAVAAPAQSAPPPTRGSTAGAAPASPAPAELASNAAPLTPPAEQPTGAVATAAGPGHIDTLSAPAVTPPGLAKLSER